jgi:hypothetical protein
MELSGLPRRLLKVALEPAALCIEENTMTTHRWDWWHATQPRVGKDVKSAGNAIEDTAEDTANDAKDDMNN